MSIQGGVKVLIDNDSPRPMLVSTSVINSGGSIHLPACFCIYCLECLGVDQALLSLGGGYVPLDKRVGRQHKAQISCQGEGGFPTPFVGKGGAAPPHKAGFPL